MMVRAAPQQLEALESRLTLSAVVPHAPTPDGHTFVLGYPAVERRASPDAWANGAGHAASHLGLGHDGGDDAEDDREGGEDEGSAGNGSSGHGGGSGTVTALSPLPLSGGGDEVSAPAVSARTPFMIVPPSATSQATGLLTDTSVAVQGGTTVEMPIAALRVARGVAITLGWAPVSATELATRAAPASWVASLSVQSMAAGCQDISTVVNPFSAATQVLVSAAVHEVTSAGIPADPTGATAAPLLSAMRPDALISLADAMTHFAYESAAVGPLFIDPSSHSHAGAWTITAAAVTADIVLLGYVYGSRRRMVRRVSPHGT